ncbi:uncharacterized protein BDCG_06615 [Blastomyces dermatitidis ER-3]|uniref:DUF7580 domain-containing protein n=2 Tax=Ajellomyces dermatitidis (strain ER-3 / ATCC MYA-2586) TaxID=559297 RepID=A0ABX2VY15_AJEDR|nr:uncharacterized protein BDCG_06615 [Blastomyces dermatitidis ER-3]OAT02040.1 hypothetical protein BDCG_06615 [Blastomyces dermatitidis ER-3]
MSGFEIAGVVLGAFPLIIHLADGYMHGVHTIQGWTRHRSQLMHLKQLLETEQTRFLNTCDSLFRACTHASTSEIEALLAGVDPTGVEWLKYQESLRDLLGRSYEPYIATISDMKDALEEMKRILNQFQETPRTKSRRARRLAFTLSRHGREELLDRISKNNNMLAALFEQRQRLEVNRRRSTSSGYGRIRQHCINIYHALNQAWGCCCNPGHIANLHLSTLTVNEMAFPADIRLRIVFQAMADQNTVTARWQWQQAYIQQVKMPESKPSERPVSTSFISSAKLSKKLPWLKQKKKVTFALPAKEKESLSPSTPSSSSSLLSTATTLALPAPTSKPPPPPLTPTNAPSGLTMISNLCATLSSLTLEKSPSPTQGSCIGYLQGHCGLPHELHLEPPDTDWEVISLHDAIQVYLSNTPSSQGEKPGSQVSSPLRRIKPLTRKERFKLAVAVSTSVLQFDDTPWLKQPWGTNDIHFFVKPFSSMPEQAYLSTAFSQTSQIPTNQQSRTQYPPLIRNKALFTLGIVLIELAFGKSLKDLRTDKDVEESLGMPDLVDTFTIKRLLEAVEDEAGYDYSEAVRRCIECPFDGKEARFTNESFQRAVHNWIIEPLKVSLNNFCGSANAASL